MKKKFPFWVLALIVGIIGIVNGIAEYWHLYFYIWWLDIPMHLLGGFWVGLSVLALYYSSKFITDKDCSVQAVFIISITGALVIGVGWELFEWGTKHIAGIIHLDIVDTLADICNDVIGAVFAAVIFIKKGYNKNI